MKKFIPVIIILFMVSACSHINPKVVVLPDTQYYSGKLDNQPLFAQQTQWIADNIESENIIFVTHLGDIVARAFANVPFDEQWPVADAAIDKLDGKVPYSVVYGGHDFNKFNKSTSGATKAKAYFGDKRYKGKAWYGGACDDGASFCQFFPLGKYRILHLALKFKPDPATIKWAQKVLAEHPSLPCILSTHSYLTDAGKNRFRKPVKAGLSREGKPIWQKLVKTNDQIFLVLCGHNRAGKNITVSGQYNEDGEYHQVSVNDKGREVFELMANYQDYPNGGDGWLQILEFDLKGNALNVRTYSPFLNKYQTDANSQFRLGIKYSERLKVD